MSSYNELIALINGCINRNGVQAITGRVLNGVLRAMVNQLGAGYAMGGVAHPTDDPGTPDAPVCYYASEVGTYTHFGNIQIVPGELALLCFDLTDGWFKETMYEGFESVQATIDGNVGTPAVNVTYVNGVLSFDFSNMKGNTGAAAGFGNVTAAVDGTIGTPGVTVQTDGPDTAKNIAFQFTGLKGETGVTSVIATVDNTSGTPQCAVSLNGQQLTLAFTGLKGAQGDTGSSVAYPFTIVNNLTTDDATQALSAAQGVVLAGQVSQLEHKVGDMDNSENLPDTEFVQAFVDNNGVFLFGIRKDGSIEWAKGIPTPIRVKLAEKVDKEVGKSLAPDEIISALSVINNPEFVEVKEDANGFLIYGIGEDGVRHFMPQYFNAPIHISPEAAETLKADLMKENFAGVASDWSDDKDVVLPIPRQLAKVNLICSALPVSKTANTPAILQYWDKDGNYFAKPIILNAQGSSSMAYIQKNLGFDLDDGSKITFGDWVSQDSFHLKCYWIDSFRGENNFCLNYTNDLIERLGCRANRRVLSSSSITKDNGSGSFDKDFGSSAKCQPDGFPIDVYFNGEYYGLFTWNLKKNRANYSMKKDNYGQILLDGNINASTLFGGVVDWTAFELRNPKTLILTDGTTKYDGEDPHEIIGTDDAAYDSTNQDHINTATTKSIIESLSEVVPTVADMPIDTPENLSLAKAYFEAHFDKDMLMCYVLAGNFLGHADGFSKNWIWAIYNNVAAPTFYDMDSMFGRHWSGAYVWDVYRTIQLGAELNLPSGQLIRLYKPEMDALYAELRNEGWFTTEKVMSYIWDWIKRQTRDAIKRNLDKWQYIPSWREDEPEEDYPQYTSTDATLNRGMYDGPKRVAAWLDARIQYLDIWFNYGNNQ